MKHAKRLLGGMALAAVLVATSTAVLAQDAAGGPPPPGADQQQAWGKMREARRAKMEAVISKRLHDVLNLSPSQDSALHTLLASLKPDHGPGDKREQPGDVAALTTPERLDRMADRMAHRQAEFQKKAEAIKAFYAQLNPEQKKAFDALPGLMGLHRGGGEHGGFGGMRDGHMGHGPMGQDGGPPPPAQ